MTYRGEKSLLLAVSRGKANQAAGVANGVLRILQDDRRRRRRKPLVLRTNMREKQNERVDIRG